MKEIIKNLTMCMCCASLMTSFSPTAEAAEYTYSSSVPGAGVFYQATSTDRDYLADTDKIVVGADGTMSNNQALPSTLFPSISTPVGVYPEAYGATTDIGIAGATIFMNETGPTSQTVNTYSPTYQPYYVDSNAYPIGGIYGSVANNSWTTSGTTGATLTAGIQSVESSLMPSVNSSGAFATLVIPALGISENAFPGTSQSNMAKGVAHFDCTPGWGGNIAFAGHNNPSSAAFSNMKNVSLGMDVIYTTAYGVATYRVTDITTVATTDTSGLMQDGSQKITMYTCVEGNASIKLKVTASLVSI